MPSWLVAVVTGPALLLGGLAPVTAQDPGRVARLVAGCPRFNCAL